MKCTEKSKWEIYVLNETADSEIPHFQEMKLRHFSYILRQMSRNLELDFMKLINTRFSKLNHTSP